MPRTSPYTIQLSGEERSVLEARDRKYPLPYGDVFRAQVVLLAAQGLRNDQIADRLNAGRDVVSKWRKRFFEQGRLRWRWWKIFDEEVSRLVGARGQHVAGRVAYRHGRERRQVTLGGRRVKVKRPRAGGVGARGNQPERHLSALCQRHQAQAGAATRGLRARARGQRLFGMIHPNP